MSMLKLAFGNFKSSFKSYLSLIISLSFTTIILCNFINLIFSGILDQLGETNVSNVESIILVLTFVIVCFMMFFVWYATNVFLNKRKKEIGIYVFMGLSNQKIGKLYMIETTFIGLVSLMLGIGFGILTSQLFTMILMRLSDIAVVIQFDFSLKSLIITSLIFIVIYMVFVIKGYINIVRSSVLDMVSANRQNEYVKQNKLFLIIKAMLGIVFLVIGFYLATKDAGVEVIGNVFIATVFIIIGIYLLFGGFLPVMFQTLAKNKRYLYKHERNLWMNSVIFRMKKNYRTSAIVSVLMLCSVTALAFGFAMKNKHEGIVHFENTYTYQVMSNESGYQQEFTDLINKKNEIVYSSDIEVAVIANNVTDNAYESMPYALLSYSQVKKSAKDTGLAFELANPKDDEYIGLNKLYVMSLTNDFVVDKNEINNFSYSSIAQSTTPYLGYLQENMEYMIVNDQVYQELRQFGEVMHIYNFKIANPKNFEASIEDIQSSSHSEGLVKINPDREEIAWIKILYSVSVFVFMVFVLASGCIIFMKLYNDAFEERDRYLVLAKLGVSKKTTNKAIANELRYSYIAPLLIMTISSYFAVKAIGNLMQVSSLLTVNIIISVFVIYAFFIICYLLSVFIYRKNINI